MKWYQQRKTVKVRRTNGTIYNRQQVVGTRPTTNSGARRAKASARERQENSRSTAAVLAGLGAAPLQPDLDRDSLLYGDGLGAPGVAGSGSLQTVADEKTETASDPEISYTIIRNYFDDDRENEIIKTGLTEAQAKAHCQDPETSSRTASPETLAEVSEGETWFDGYEQRVKTYDIQREHPSGARQIIATGLTLDEARAHCKHPEHPKDSFVDGSHEDELHPVTTIRTARGEYRWHRHGTVNIYNPESGEEVDMFTLGYEDPANPKAPIPYTEFADAVQRHEAAAAEDY